MRLTAFQRLALLTTATTYSLIGVGGLVRVTGSGLGCPDWPRCFDRWIPPLSVADVPSHIDPALFNFAKAWTEYVNRLLGVLVGFLIFATLILAIRAHRKDPRILWTTVAAFVLVGFEGWLGGVVVTSGLFPWILTAHLTVALIIGALLLYATVQAFLPLGASRPMLGRPRALLARAIVFTTLLALLQVGLGAMVRGQLQDIARNLPQLARDLWLSELWLDAVHEAMAVVVAIAVAAIAYWVEARRDSEPALKWASRGAVLLVALQALAGIAMARTALPPWLQGIHLWGGSLLLADLTVFCLLAYRLHPAANPENRLPPPTKIARSPASAAL